MDVDDLFGAFDGKEKVNNVNEAVGAEPSVVAGKRKAVAKESASVGYAGGGTKRQALPADADNKRGLDPSVVAGVKESVSLKEGEESSTMREDGTFVKSVRATNSRGVETSGVDVTYGGTLCCCIRRPSCGAWFDNLRSSSARLLCLGRHALLHLAVAAGCCTESGEVSFACTHAWHLSG